MFLNNAQQSAFDLAVQGHNLYIGGQAGTGKTFVISKIVQRLKQDGKKIQLTCTTGISCSVYKTIDNVMTIHSFSGIEDGRYDTSTIVSLIRTNVKFKDTLQRIRDTDVLIIDEISMLSSKLFDQVENICAIRNPQRLFGGMQVIVCGDFYQLPPVPNVIYGDPGDFCFTSEVFKDCFSHHIFLTEIIRHNEAPLIKAVKEVSLGLPSPVTCDFISSLSRPIKDTCSSTKLFATNFLVDDYNRRRLLELDGDVVEFKSTDSGEDNYLSKVLAPKRLWLKPGCPVMLLRNLSRKLVNGLTGTVVGLDKDGPDVHFATIDVTMKIPKVQFTVFSPRKQKNLASREQYPLKLAYAMTIHKSQGMTLDSVEVDCSGIFKPGQIAVAMGRAKSIQGLRVINFRPELCIQPSTCIAEFVTEPSLPHKDDCSCCRINRRPGDSGGEDEYCFSVEELTARDVYSYEQYEDQLDQHEDEFDEEFNEAISSKEVFTGEENNYVSLPEDFHVLHILRNVKVEQPITPFQKEVNDIVDVLLKNVTTVEQYCSKEFVAMSAIIDSINAGKAVKSDKLTEVYANLHKYHLSAEHIINCLILFENAPSYREAQCHISYSLSVSIRKYLLQGKVNLLPKGESNVTVQRTVTSGCLARVRYVGGYCVSKSRYLFFNKQLHSAYKPSVEEQLEYEECCTAVKLLDALTVNESVLQQHSDIPETLIDVSRKQNLMKGLTHISDELYYFFVLLCDSCLQILKDEHAQTHLYTLCLERVMSNCEIYEKFVKITSGACENVNRTFSENSEITSILNDMVLKASVINRVFIHIIKKFLMVMLNQFKKDLLQALSVQKTMSHRKQILVRKQKSQYSVPEEVSTPCETSNSTISQSSSQSAEPSTSTSESSETLCAVCQKVGKSKYWIQCDSCSKWLHRNCAGLRLKAKWEAIQNDNTEFHCINCNELMDL